MELTLVCGLSGTGKTTVSRTIVEETGAVLLRSDEIRLEAPGLTREQRYARDVTHAVHIEMARRAAALLERGSSVVLDAKFSEECHRALMRRTAEAQGAVFRVLEVRCDDDVAEKRIAQRRGDASEVTVDVRRRQRAEWEPITDPFTVVRTDGTREETAEQVRVLLPTIRQSS